MHPYAHRTRSVRRFQFHDAGRWVRWPLVPDASGAPQDRDAPMHRPSSERHAPCRVDCRTRLRVTSGAFQEEWADKSRAVRWRRFLQARHRDKPRKLTPSRGDGAVPAGRTVPAPDGGAPRLILRRPERARGCRAWRGQGSGLLVEGRFVAAGAALLRSRFPFQIPAKASELNLVSIAQFYRDYPKLYGELLDCLQIGSYRALLTCGPTLPQLPLFCCSATQAVSARQRLRSSWFSST